jgi:hypothetical protein
MDRAALRDYLNDHLAGSTFALDLVRRRAERHPGDIGRVLREFATELEEDQRYLRAAMKEVGAQPQLAKHGLVILGSWVDALRPRRRPPSLVRDIEVLASGVHTKGSLWATLRRLADSGNALLASSDIDRLQQRAATQEHELSVLHDRAVQQDLDGAR